MEALAQLMNQLEGVRVELGMDVKATSPLLAESAPRTKHTDQTEHVSDAD